MAGELGGPCQGWIVCLGSLIRVSALRHRLDCLKEAVIHKRGTPMAIQVWHMTLCLLYSVLSLNIFGWADEDSSSFLQRESLLTCKNPAIPQKQ